MTHPFYRSVLLGTAFSLSAGLVQADTVLTTSDGIIKNSLCVGGSCLNSETFGSDTIRLKEANLRIHFDDISTSASFPSNDWRIVANSATNGGGDFLAFQDATAGVFPFVVEAGARANALYVDDSGRLGIGTSTPVANLHAVTGNTPTLRLAQDGSSGFAAQTWDIAGNETNFFIRDVTNASTLPFRIRPGAPTSALSISADGDVGIGTYNPAGKLHTRGLGTQVAYFESSDAGAVQIRMRTNSQNRRFLATNNADETQSQIVFRDDEVQFAGATNTGANLWATISAAGIVTQGPDCNAAPCDRTFDPDYFQPMSIEDHAAYMWENQHLWGVGPTGPGQPFNVTEKTAGILHALEVAHIYIAQQNEVIQTMQQRLDTVEAHLAQ